MKLKSSLDLERFFTAVRHCQGRVTFETEEGDSLNLIGLIWISGQLRNAPGGHLICGDHQDLTSFTAG